MSDLASARVHLFSLQVCVVAFDTKPTAGMAWHRSVSKKAETKDMVHLMCISMIHILPLLPFDSKKPNNLCLKNM